MARLSIETVWSPIELTLRADRRYENPYTDVTVRATFEHESGETHEIPGFWDGGNTWRVRFAPTRPGQWEYAIGSEIDEGISDESDDERDDSGLTAEGAFEATAYEGPNPLKRHGYLRPDGRQLVHDDGTPFFWLADTAWSAGAKATPEEWDEYLTARREQGFNVVQVNALPQHDASRPWDRLPFGEEWNLDQPDPEYFRALDDLVAMAHDRGVLPALVALWFNYAPGTWPDWDQDADRHPFDEAKAARFGRYLGARYGAYGTAWLVSGDTNYEQDDDAALDVYDAAAAAIGESVTHPLRTTHMVGGLATPPHVADRDWLDFHLYQSSHVSDLERPPEMAVQCRARDGKPVINGEPPYERHEFFDEDGVRISRETARKAAWLSVLAGGNAGVTYGGHGIWQWHRDGEKFAGASHTGMPDPWHESLSYPGARDYGALRQFFERFDFGALEPRQDVLADSSSLVRAAELSEDDIVLVYTAEGDDLVLDADATAGADLAWVQPDSWNRVPATADVTADGAVIDAPPWNGDALLVCRS